ncbi:MAG: 2Fe-2S ferredoxin [Sphingomonas bacterium]|uniref:2Fe-2S iron-sulfur cluster-binding protein n=1 Tax=Sphingomonas bacterium TaxID=1895847 RepID=UPI002620A160|nr:2Fe-2S iron-sulfur cluster-binding protein [Sphingomonas bacterium]MDB5703870.1 2Fe-2S ferredoxin [Sphingomonas bacterium]
MATINFIDHQGTKRVVEAEAGSVMEAAVNNGIPGIDADCGGACACATCHVFVAADWTGIVGTATPDELDLLEFVDGVTPNSRLSCQIPVSDEIDGITVTTPATQH